MVARLLESGDLPHLAMLRDQGGFSRVATTRPAQTPVAWSTFATGVNPGGHGVFDFIRRNPATYLPELALNRYEQKNAFLPPRVVNLRRGAPVWDSLTAAGRGATILRCPCTYPPDRVRGAMLSGLGTPDLRGGLGTPAYYTTEPGVEPRESERVITLDHAPAEVYKTHLIGPRDPKTGGDVAHPLLIKVDRANRKVVIESEGTPRALEVSRGAWSDWLRVKFKLGLLQSARGMVRFHLVSCEPDLRLYASPLNFDPAGPLFPISDPPEYAGRLAQRIGLFYTTGMVEDHTGLNNERIDEDAFLDQCAIAWRDREAMMLDELAVHDDGLFYCLFDTPDRIQHMFWRYGEPDHPAHRGRAVDARYQGVIDDCYRRADDAVGRALEFADPETLVIVLSDHGFSSFQRGVHLNTWLRDNGFLALKGGVEPGPEAGDMLQGVDWDRTRAYALGLGGIYLNCKGREANGIVDQGEVEGLKSAIARGLGGLVDPDRGREAVRGVVARERAYHGPFVHEAPDLIVDFAAGYRVSWSSSLGGTAAGWFEDNVKKWSGDHIIDPALVPGVLFMNQPFRGENPRLEDLAPTILDALGLAKGSAMEGDSLSS